MELTGLVNEDPSVALDDDFVVVHDERNFAGDGPKLTVTARAEDGFQGVYIDDVVKWLNVFGGPTTRRRERFDYGVDERHFIPPRILRGRDRFGSFL